MVSDLVDKIGRVLPFITQAQQQVLSDDTELLEETIRRMFEIVLDTAEFTCSYVHHSPLSTSLIFPMSIY